MTTSYGINAIRFSSYRRSIVCVLLLTLVSATVRPVGVIAQTNEEKDKLKASAIMFGTLGTLAVIGVWRLSQKERADATRVADIRWEQKTPGVVTVFYSLSYERMAKDPNRVFEIELRGSTDGGRTFNLKPKSVRGDIGKGVTPGPQKEIHWDAWHDYKDLQSDAFVFRVRAKFSKP